jgi:hypothetical protein
MTALLRVTVSKSRQTLARDGVRRQISHTLCRKVAVVAMVWAGFGLQIALPLATAEEGVVPASATSPAVESKSPLVKPTEKPSTAPEKNATENSSPKAPVTAPVTTPVAVLRRVGGLDWFTDYSAAYRDAEAGGRQLLVVFHDPRSTVQRDNFEREVLARPELATALAKVSRAMVPTDATLPGVGDAKPQRVLASSVFNWLGGGAGLAVVDLADRRTATFGSVISVHPFSGRMYYGVQATETILSLPPGTMTQRAMVFALRMHPERPQSVWGSAHPTLMYHSREASQLMAQSESVGHHNWGGRLAQIQSQSSLSPFEVAAVSFGAPNPIDAASEIVQNWRGSGAHWGGISSPQRWFGYDMVQGPSGRWYGNGLFAN